MKKLILLSMIAMVMPLELLAQDDMYFVPTREQAEQTVREYGLPRDTYYIGSRRSVDEYNRRGSYYEVLDSVGSDTIDFDGIAGVYPDTLYLDEPTDYRYTRRMSRFDGFEPSSEYLAGYLDGRSYWYSPWYLNSWYYSPIRYSYYGWVDPWTISWYDPWYDPWYYRYGYGYGYYGYYSPWRYDYYYGGWYGGWSTAYLPHHYGSSWTPRSVGTRNHGHVARNTGSHGVRNNGTVSHSHGTFGGSRIGSGTFGNPRRSGNTNSAPRRNDTRNNTYTPPRNNTSTNSSGNFGGSRTGGGSFGGGSHSGGSFGGGSHGGGGHGGGSFGGRRH